MSRYRFDLATPADDARLRRILVETPMPGNIAVSFCREPSYFQAAVVDGNYRQVVTARDSQDGEAVGFGSRSVSERYVNGELLSIGYLSGLRLLAAHRNRGLVARGYAYFQKLHQDGRTQLYLTTIAEGNETGQQILTSGRAGLPGYHRYGSFHTLVIPLRRSMCATLARDMQIRPATVADAPQITTYLREQGPRRQFFPNYEVHDLFNEHGVLRGLQPRDVLLAHRDERLVGILAAWDQHDFRQSVVHGYYGRMRWVRPIYNRWAAWRRLPKLPDPGESFRYLTAALCVVGDDDPAVFESLLRSSLASAASGPADHLMLGLHQSDPLLSIARRYQSACYTTHLYLVCWEDGEALRATLDGRPPYLELGSL